MFDKFLAKFRSSETADEAGSELVRQLAHELAFMTSEEKSKLTSGEKLEAPEDLKKKYGEALSLLEDGGLSEEIRNGLEDIVKSIEEAYLIG